MDLRSPWASLSGPAAVVSRSYTPLDQYIVVVSMVFAYFGPLIALVSPSPAAAVPVVALDSHTLMYLGAVIRAVS